MAPMGPRNDTTNFSSARSVKLVCSDIRFLLSELIVYVGCYLGQFYGPVYDLAYPAAQMQVARNWIDKSVREILFVVVDNSHFDHSGLAVRHVRYRLIFNPWA